MTNPRRDDNDELRNRDLSRKAVLKLSGDEKRELKRRFEEFITAMRRSQPAGKGRVEPASRTVKWDPHLHKSQGKQSG